MLSLNGEKKTWREVDNVLHTGRERLIGLSVVAVRVKIAMHQEGQVPNAGEEQPTGGESGREQHEDPLPTQVQDGDEEVLEEVVRLAVRGADGVEGTVFGDDAVAGRLFGQHVQKTGFLAEWVESEIESGWRNMKLVS